MLTNLRGGANKLTHLYHSLIRYKSSGVKKTLTGGQLIYQKLLENGVNDVFMYTGGAVMPLIDAFADGKINYYINTHEQSLGHAATGYAKSTGKPGVCVVTSGPGLTNLVTPITDANNDSSPLIVFSGQVPKKAMGSAAFQECPSTEITKSITKWNYCVEDINILGDVVDEAFRVATHGKPGVVHIDLPKCVTSALYDYTEPIEGVDDNHIPKHLFPSPFLDKTESDIDNKKIIEVSKLITNAKRPVIIVGKGCQDAYQQLRKFVRITNIPVTSTIFGMGVLPETHNLSLEFLGMHGHVAANYAVQNADLIINLGSRFDDRTTGNVDQYGKLAKDAYHEREGGIVHVNLDRSEICKNIDSHYNFITPCSNFLDKLLPLLRRGVKRKPWLRKIKTWKKQYPFNTNTPPDQSLNTQLVIDSLGRWLNKHRDDYLVSTGVGNHQMMSAQFIKWNQPNQFLTSGSLGVMGTGLPYAIGAQIANPNHLVVDIDGDGSFNHTLAELKTVANYGLPVKIAIMNDGELAMVKAWEHLFFGSRYVATDLGENPDYVRLAESFGIPALRCSSQDELEVTVDTFLGWEGPVLCDFRVKADLCLPLVKPGNALDEMFLFGDQVSESTGEMKISEVPG